MKLWQKISLICSLVLLMVMAICIFSLSYHARNKMLGISIADASNELEELESDFKYECYKHVSQEDSPSVKNSLLEYCFSKHAKENTQLFVEDKLVFSNSKQAMINLLPLEETTGKDYLIYTDKESIVLGRTVRFPEYTDTLCRIYLLKDISALHSEIVSMQLQFIGFGIMFSLLALAIIIFLVRHSMKGLVPLENAAREIEKGNYHVRTKLQTKDELGIVAQSFDKMAQSVEKHVTELEESAYRQKLFAGALSHEFKTPLTSILLNTDNLKNTYMTENETQEALCAIEEQSKWMESLTRKVLSLLTVSKNIEKAEITVSELLEKVKESAAEKLKTSGCILVVESKTEYIYGDADLLQSALVNLLDNAIKASQPGQDIILGAEDGMLYVKDFGRGISGEALNRVTEPFFMEDKSRSKKSGGVGLGLALVHEIAEAHNAKLEIDSEVGKGCTAKIIFAGNKTVICR